MPIKLLCYLIFLLPSFALHAAEPASPLAKLEVGSPAPHFEGLSDLNKKWNSKDQAGKKTYVVYFYPADMTPGCTKQACSYRDASQDLKSLDVEVIGVSGDSVENHQHFKQQHNLNFMLLADPEGKIAKAFGVPAGKGGEIQRIINGEELTLARGVTAKRWTFVIDKDWKIAYKNTSVNAAKDSNKVLEVVKKLQNSPAEASTLP